MGASYPTKVRLAARSGDQCAFPGCNKKLTLDGGKKSEITLIGVAAHIAGEEPSSARYDPAMTPKERDHFNNLIYLCRDHHHIIDEQEGDYPVEELHKWKKEHADKVREAMNEAFAEVGFPELEQVTDWITDVQPKPTSRDFSLVPPADKIKKNELSERVYSTMTMGLSIAQEVRAFINAEVKIDNDFPERLKVGFLKEYYRLRKNGYKGDELFDLMCKFSQRGFKENVKKAAGLAVLMYLFEACEVFEK